MVFPETAILVLAAGQSSRMGRPKQLLPWKETTLLEHSLKNALTVTEDVFVVLGAYYQKILPTLRKHTVHILHNTEWEQGMGTSISLGIKAIKKNPSFTSVLIMLGDQPLLEGNHLRALIEHFKETQKPITATAYDSNGGVPAVFDTALFHDLEGMDQNWGAKQLIKTHDCETVLPVGILTDIDTPKTYKELFEQYGH